MQLDLISIMLLKFIKNYSKIQLLNKFQKIVKNSKILIINRNWVRTIFQIFIN